MWFLEGPEVPSGLDIDLGLRSLLRAGAIARVWCADLHPAGEGVNLRVGEFVLRRHLQVAVRVGDRFDEEALSRVTGDDDLAGVTAVHPSGLGVEGEAAFEFRTRHRIEQEICLSGFFS
jgi:hypothetical protein